METANRLIKKPLSSSEIKQKLGGKVKVVTYSQLSKCKTMQQLLEPHNRVVLLYETAPNWGHWVCLLRDPKNKFQVDFLDPYSIFPDDELLWISERNRQRLGEKENRLSNIMMDWIDQGGTVDYNTAKLQAEGKDVNTCGYHCVVRLFRDDLTPTQYTKWIKKSAKTLGFTTDQFVTLFYHLLR